MSAIPEHDMHTLITSRRGHPKRPQIRGACRRISAGKLEARVGIAVCRSGMRLLQHRDQLIEHPWLAQLRLGQLVVAEPNQAGQVVLTGSFVNQCDQVEILRVYLVAAYVGRLKTGNPFRLGGRRITG